MLIDVSLNVFLQVQLMQSQHWLGRFRQQAIISAGIDHNLWNYIDGLMQERRVLVME